MYTAGNAHLLWSGHFPIQKVLSTEQQTDKYAATMETAAATKEDALFSNVSATSTAKPAGFSNDNNNQRASKLNGAVGTAGNKRVGPSIVLKVMTGDTISISTWSWYSGAVQPPATGVADIATELLPLLTAGVSGAGGSKGGAIPTTYSDPLLSGDLRKFLDSNRVYSGTRPKAFLNWMVVDEEFAGVKSTNYMSAVQIPLCNAGDTLKQVVGLNQMVIRRNGWIYIYLSNESNQDVFFDNLVVNLTHGPLVEQKDYYAFGMENPALSTKAIKFNYKENRLKFNGKELQSKEFSDSSGLEWEDFEHRMYDVQIGRFCTQDRIVDSFPSFSPYSYAQNNPILNMDIMGDSAWSVKRDWNNNDVKDFATYAQNKLNEMANDNTVKLDCADAVLTVLIGYASENGLPLQLQTSDGKNTFNSNSDDFSDVKGFTTTVLNTMQAKDIASNTFTLHKTDAQPGDMMILTSPHDHIAAYSDINSKTDVTQRNLVYGNLLGGKPTNLVKTQDWSNSTSGGIKYAPDKKTAHRWNVLNKK